MTTSTRAAEADRVELVYYWALNQIGNVSYEDAVDLWQDVPASEQAVTAGRWLAAAVRLVMTRRARARDLALAYYRLTRALRTGHSIRLPGREEGESVSLEALRDEFDAVVDQIDAETAPPALPDTSTGDSTPTTTEAVTAPLSDSVPTDPKPDYTDAMYEDDEDIVLEELAGLEDEIAAQERAAEEEAANALDQLGIENMLSKLEEAKKAEEAEKADAARKAAHEAAGRRQAASASRITMNAARGLVYSLADTDARVIGWARYSPSGTPCGWCAMLISRGAVYKSAASAGAQDEYHDNCRCIAVPIFDISQMDTDLFALNREYEALWNKHIRGKFGGDRALSEWRKLIRQMHKQNTATAREAA